MEKPSLVQAFIQAASTDQPDAIDYEAHREALLPCPFCGGATVLIMETLNIDGGRVGNPYRITCNHCFVSTGQYVTEAEAITAWNTRR